jgi:hypothetical protein
MTIYLDAPAHVLFARKGEGTVELLQQKRDVYQNLGDAVLHFTRLDATQTPDEVLQQALDAIHALYKVHSTKAAST